MEFVSVAHYVLFSHTNLQLFVFSDIMLDIMSFCKQFHIQQQTIIIMWLKIK